MPSQFFDEVARRAMGLTENLSNNLSAVYNVRETELNQSTSQETEPKQTEPIHRNKLSPSIKKPSKKVGCIVHLLDNKILTFDIDKHANGQLLLDTVFDHLGILEKDYFGLKYRATESRSQFNQKFLNSQLLHLKNFNLNSSHSSNLSSQCQNEPQEVWKWLDTGKSIKHQLKCDPPFRLYFKVRFYVANPSQLQEEITRYQFFLQLRNDILDGKLFCPYPSLIKLASYVVQSELGDYSPEEHTPGYLSGLKLVPKQDSVIENEIAKLHRAHAGQTPAQAENNFFQHVRTLDTYGIEMHRAKNQSGENILIGVGSAGIVVFNDSNMKTNSAAWSKIVKLSFKSKYFYIQLRRDVHSDIFDETVVCFNLLNYRQCKRLWKCCVQNHTFFRLQTPKPQCKKLFFFLSLGSRFRYSGRTEFQALEESRNRARPDSGFSRTASKRFARQTMPSLHSSQQVTEPIVRRADYDDLSASSSIRNLNATDSPSTGGSFWRTGLSFKLLNKAASNLSTSVMKANVRSLTKLNSRKSNGLIGNKLVTSTSNSELKTHKVADPSQLRDSTSNYRLADAAGSTRTNGLNPLHLHTLLPIRREESIDDDKLSALNSINKLMNQKSSSPSHAPPNLISSLKSVGSASKTTKITESSTQLVKEAWISAEESSPTNASPIITVNCTSTQTSKDDSLSTSLTTNSSSRSSLPYNRNNLMYIDKFDENPNEIIDEIIDASFNESGRHGKNLRLNLTGGESPSLITVKLKLDKDEMFGFNVKGGSDQNLPVIVTRVAPKTPADGILNEGDQVISVNGHPVFGITHEQVIKLIRSVEDRTEDGELVLQILPQSVYQPGLGTDSELSKDEPAFQYNSLDSSLSKNKKKSNKLHESIMLLVEGLESGSLVDQFERLYCEKPDEDIIIAKLPANLLKNRYRDISPYDSTRVKIKNGTDEDYINASHVNMEIKGTGIVNRYIATQGPLCDTTQDFWTMVEEQKCSLIVMVTPLIENDFIKCHKYWPDLNDTLKLHDDMKLQCIKQTESNIMVERKFNLSKAGKKRVITHLLYKAWPDHGVPDDSTHFHQLINTVRRYRASFTENSPIIVHCSAGIGRTGVLILMETAMCLMENNLPVYPLELLKTMRDQRARLIQTPSQFTFVLQAIVEIYQKESQLKSDAEKR